VGTLKKKCGSRELAAGQEAKESPKKSASRKGSRWKLETSKKKRFSLP